MDKRKEANMRVSFAYPSKDFHSHFCDSGFALIAITIKMCKKSGK